MYCPRSRSLRRLSRSLSRHVLCSSVGGWPRDQEIEKRRHTLQPMQPEPHIRRAHHAPLVPALVVPVHQKRGLMPETVESLVQLLDSLPGGVDARDDLAVRLLDGEIGVLFSSSSSAP